MWGPCVGRQAGRWPGRGRPSLPGKAAKGAGGPAILADAGAAGKTGPPQPFSRLQEKGWLRYSAPILLIGATPLPPPFLALTPPRGSSLSPTPNPPASAADSMRRQLEPVGHVLNAAALLCGAGGLLTGESGSGGGK